ncbi:MAG: rhomboid family intramembrane serine protease [Gammaproteobacteria bacterium]|nr:rhomboid family intramembrane serine protease [Gammaproteobacteria bacterium]
MKITELTIFIGLLWLIVILDSGMGHTLSHWGVIPRTAIGLRGIFFWTFLHNNSTHLMANTLPLAMLAWFVLLRGFKTFFVLTLAVTVIAGCILWLIGRPAIHVGSSGLIFGYFGFLVALGWYEHSFKAWFFSIFTLLLYGGIIWGVLPQEGHISWEGHLSGLIAGWYMASQWARKTIRANTV